MNDQHPIATTTPECRGNSATDLREYHTKLKTVMGKIDELILLAEKLEALERRVETVEQFIETGVGP